MGRPPKYKQHLALPGGHSSDDSAFYAKHEYRKPRVLELGEPPAYRKPLKSGGVIDDAFKAKVKKYYGEKWPIKRIAVELGCGTNTVNRVRRELGIEPHAPKNVPNKIPLVDLKITMSKVLADRIERAYFGRYKSKSAYIRALVTRDLEGRNL